jgi:hypothetical protein
MESIKNLIAGDRYQSLLENVRKETNIQIDQADLPSAILNFDADMLKSAKIDAQVLGGILETDLNEVSKYSILRLGLVKDDDQEYPEGNEPDEDDKDEVIETLPYYKNFLVSFLVEYYFLKNKPSELAAYLKAERIPNAKKFEKELKEAYSSI